MKEFKRGYNLADWLNHEGKNDKRLYTGALFYVIVITVFFAVIFVFSLRTKTEIVLSIDNFSFEISEPSNTIYFTGIVPYEVLEDMDLEKIHLMKVYFSARPRETFGSRKKFYIPVYDNSLSEQEYNIRDEHLSDYRQKLRAIRLMQAAIFRTKLSNVDVNGKNVTDLFSGGDVSVRKVKLILGETSVFSFWINRLFSKSPLFKRAVQLMD